MSPVSVLLDGNIRFPFFDYDRGLFTQLVKSRMGHWEQSDRNYHIFRPKYDPDQFPEYWRGKLEIEIRSRKYSDKTRKSYINYNRELCRWLQKKPEEVTSDDIKRYLAFLEQIKQHSYATLNYNLSAFKFFYRNIMKRDTVCEQKRPRQDKRLPVVLSKNEVKKIIDSEPNTKHRLLLMMVYASGFRVSEVVNLKMKN